MNIPYFYTRYADSPWLHMTHAKAFARYLDLWISILLKLSCSATFVPLFHLVAITCCSFFKSFCVPRQLRVLLSFSSCCSQSFLRLPLCQLLEYYQNTVTTTEILSNTRTSTVRRTNLPKQPESLYIDNNASHNNSNTSSVMSDRYRSLSIRGNNSDTPRGD